MGKDFLRKRIYISDGDGGSISEIRAVLNHIRSVGGKEAARQLGINVNETTTEGGNIKHHAKILVFDIETAPLLAHIWSAWNQNVGYNLDQIVSDWFMLTWSAKWLFDENIMSAKLTPEEAVKQDDSRITKLIWELFNEADIVIAHNALKFDNKRLNTRFLLNELPPPLPYQTIDTLAHARKKFSMTSNKLDYLAKMLGLTRKIDTGGIDLWKKCYNGDSEALDMMEKYNIGDIRTLEEVYLALRPFITPHPNLGLYIEENVQCCPSCGSLSLEWGGTYATNTNLYDSFRCNDCGSIGRSRNTSIPKEQRRHLTTSVPR